MRKKFHNGRKRPYRKKGFKRYRKSGISNTFKLFNTPLNSKVTHKFCERVRLDPAGLGMIVETYSANDPRRPSITGGTAHNAMGFDQMIKLYSEYYVASSTCTIQYVATGVPVTNNNSNIIAIYSTNDGNINPGNSMMQMIEENNIKFKVLQATINTPDTYLREKYSPQKMFRVKDVADENDLRGNYNLTTNTFTAVPAPSYYHVLCDSLFSIDDSYAVDIIITIYYNTVWTTPQVIPQSVL